MYATLTELNKTSGIKGSMLVGADGIIIAADLESDLEDDTVGALSASILAGVKKAIKRLNYGALKQIMVEAEKGKIFLAECRLGILVVLTETEVNIGLIRLEMKAALKKVENQTVSVN